MKRACLQNTNTSMNLRDEFHVIVLLPYVDKISYDMNLPHEFHQAFI